MTFYLITGDRYRRWNLVWMAVAAYSTLTVGLQDGWILSTLIWVLEMLAIGTAVPWMMARLGRVFPKRICAVLDAGLVIGVPVGVCVGVVSPIIFQYHSSAAAAGRIGLVVGLVSVACFCSALMLLWAGLSGIAFFIQDCRRYPASVRFTNSVLRQMVTNSNDTGSSVLPVYVFQVSNRYKMLGIKEVPLMIKPNSTPNRTQDDLAEYLTQLNPSRFQQNLQEVRGFKTRTLIRVTDPQLNSAQHHDVVATTECCEEIIFRLISTLESRGMVHAHLFEDGRIVGFVAKAGWFSSSYETESLPHIPTAINSRLQHLANIELHGLGAHFDFYHSAPEEGPDKIILLVVDYGGSDVFWAWYRDPGGIVIAKLIQMLV